MRWHDVRTNHPAFIWNEAALLRAEWLYLGEIGQTAGAAKHLSASQQTDLIVDALTADAVASLELEGRLVERSEMEDCIRSRLGLAFHEKCGEPFQCGMAELAVRILQRDHVNVTLDHIEELGVSMGGENNLIRLNAPVMDASLNALSREKEQAIRDIRRELGDFVSWYGGIDRADAVVSPLTQAGLTHLWFETIQPFRFGSGVVGRALTENALMWRHPGIPFVPVAPVLLQYKNEYYRSLDQACRDRDATEWLLWFAAICVEAVRRYRAMIRFRREREELLERFRDSASRRQEAILLHMFGLGVERFACGISVKRYSEHSGIPLSVVAADMANLAGCGALIRKVRGKSIRYHLNVTSPEVDRVLPGEIQ